MKLESKNMDLGNIDLKKISKNIRKICLEQVSRANSSHIGSMFSIVDILTYLYYAELDVTEDNYKDVKDRVILSKGHASLAVYAILYDKGILKRIDDYCTNGSYLIGHLSHKIPGVSVSTGSLGHGLSVAAGISLGLKIDKSKGKVYCLIGDGECDEGSIWEALIFISNNDLDNLVILVDANKLQGYDFTERILPEKRLISMMRSTGLPVYEADGHNFEDIAAAFKFAEHSKKSAILFFHTIKGKGVSFMENRLEWHYKSPNSKELKDALSELDQD